MDTCVYDCTAVFTFVMKRDACEETHLNHPYDCARQRQASSHACCGVVLAEVDATVCACDGGRPRMHAAGPSAHMLK